MASRHVSSSVHHANSKPAASLSIIQGGVRDDGDFTADQISEFREVFNYFDKDNDGFLNTHEVGDAMRALGENPTEAELKNIIDQITAHPTPSQISRGNTLPPDEDGDIQMEEKGKEKEKEKEKEKKPKKVPKKAPLKTSESRHERVRTRDRFACPLFVFF